VLTHRQHEEIDAKYPVPAWTPLALILMRVLLWPFPFARRRMGSTMAGRVGKVGRLESGEKFREAFDLAMETIPLCLKPHGRVFFSRSLGASLDQMNSWYWWFFLGRAARCARKLGPEERRRVIDVLPSAPEPGGKEQAMLFDEMSRWRWKENDATGAMELSKQAIQADPTWPYAYVTMAFYAHRTGRLDPLPLLIDAVRADPEVRHHIESEFEESPDLLAALRSAAQPS